MDDFRFSCPGWDLNPQHKFYPLIKRPAPYQLRHRDTCICMQKCVQIIQILRNSVWDENFFTRRTHYEYFSILNTLYFFVSFHKMIQSTLLTFLTLIQPRKRFFHPVFLLIAVLMYQQFHFHPSNTQIQATLYLNLIWKIKTKRYPNLTIWRMS